MSETSFYSALLYSFLGLAALTFPFLFFVTAPYGRYTRERWGPKLHRSLGWVLMEAPSPIGFALFFVLGDRQTAPAAIVFLLLWQAHYLHRAFIFPFRLRGDKQRITLITALMGLTFNLANSYLNGRYLFTLGPAHGADWLWDPRFLGGAALFVSGLAINLHADTVLINLRRPGEQGYRIPHGGLFRLVSCPNYLGEIVEWTGWALLTWSPPGLAFALWTAANLGPRAYTHHQWYRRQFPEYPKGRRALIPFLLALLAFGCSSCSETTPDPPGAATSVTLANQSAAAGLSFPAVEDLTRSPDPTQTILGRFFVPREAAERYAHGFVQKRGYLAAPVTTCLALPREDGAGDPVGWHFILAHEASCQPFAALLQQASDLWAQSDGTPAGEAPVLTLKRAMEASSERFTFIEVAAHTFRHPLREAHRGLPSWIFSAARGELPLNGAGCAPEAVLPPIQGHHYLVRYLCGDSRLSYSHTRRQVLPAARRDAAPSSSAAFVRWQQVIRAKYGAETARYLDSHRTLWERHLLDAPPARQQAAGEEGGNE